MQVTLDGHVWHDVPEMNSPALTTMTAQCGLTFEREQLKGYSSNAGVRRSATRICPACAAHRTK